MSVEFWHWVIILFASLFVYCIRNCIKSLYLYMYLLTHKSLASHLWGIGKQCRPRSDAHCLLTEISITNRTIMNKYTWHPLNDKWTNPMIRMGKSIRLIWVNLVRDRVNDTKCIINQLISYCSNMFQSACIIPIDAMFSMISICCCPWFIREPILKVTRN